ncbi:hypothetical protein T02_6657 [Trichinella nativa]|uniref:Uncharacterized protein n=1 Tax=Trichinella nativa TaxID=6335 RepID=A0A0V1LNE6_9BILA|nr:hypothetical protein T02_6657 [Trichinella nativa]
MLDAYTSVKSRKQKIAVLILFANIYGIKITKFLASSEIVNFANAVMLLKGFIHAENILFYFCDDISDK